MHDFTITSNEMTEYIQLMMPTIGIFLLWSVSHYIAPRLYIYLCVPSTILGFIMTPFASTMPHCKALRWVISTSADNINAMIVLFGTWLIMVIMRINKKTDN